MRTVQELTQDNISFIRFSDDLNEVIYASTT